MTETELKFQVPIASRRAVQRAVSTTTAQHIALRARYFDTADRRLAQAGLALRLRMEGSQWVQTLKGAGASALHRVEHEVRLDPQDAEPSLDLTRHAGTPAARALEDALGHALDRAPGDAPEDANEALQVMYETDVLRTLRQVRCDGAVVEMAFDVGEVISGQSRVSLCEIEFELKQGKVQGLLTLAARWARRHRLWLDVRSKAERGDRLARGVEAGSVVSARRPRLTAAMGSDAALRTIVACCLAQILPNSADVAAGVGGAEHLHQLRVGMRRLRSALRVFGDGSEDTDPAWLPELAALFARLGATRDRDVITETVLPELRQAGSPLAELPEEGDVPDAGEALRGVDFNLLMLRLIGFCEVASPADVGHEQPSILALARPRIRRMRRRLRADAQGFVTADDTERHRTRKRLKRLRYSIEFVASLHSTSSVKVWLDSIRAAQDVLGRYNDLSVAEQAFRAQAQRDPRAWFCVGWLVAQREQLVPQAAAALQHLAQVPKLRRKRK